MDVGQSDSGCFRQRIEMCSQNSRIFYAVRNETFFMTLCSFCLENFSMLNASWPSSGQNCLFPRITFHGPCLQSGLLPTLHNVLVYCAFVSREVHF